MCVYISLMHDITCVLHVILQTRVREIRGNSVIANSIAANERFQRIIGSSKFSREPTTGSGTRNYPFRGESLSYHGLLAVQHGTVGFAYLKLFNTSEIVCVIVSILP